MKRFRYRAWQFVHPDFSTGTQGRYPGLEVSPTGGIAMAEGEESVRQSILLLLSTVPGERVMRPHYGCDLRRLVFSPNDDTTAGLAIHYVRQAIRRWEPRVEILRLDAGRSEIDPGWLEIVLDYRVKVSQRVEQLKFSFDVGGD